MKQGIIYAAWIGRTRFVKVGFTTDLRQRLSALRWQFHRPLRVICTAPATLVQEQALHRSFRLRQPHATWRRFYCKEVYPCDLLEELLAAFPSSPQAAA